MKQANLSFQGNNIVLHLRSALFFVLIVLNTVVLAPIVALAYPLSFRIRYAIAQCWVAVALWLVKTICGIHYQIEGQENIPKDNGIIVCKHQSAWETIALQKIFPAQVFILKRELLWLPFFGWAMAACEPIAINRSLGKAALRQIISQGIDRLNKGRWVVIFPEGTRVSPGEKVKYGVGGGMLAVKSGHSIVPVAHNAGEFWGKYSFLKYPGTIQVRIGPAISPANRSASEINNQAHDWIETQMLEIAAL